MTITPEFLRHYSRWVKFDWLPIQAAILALDEFPTATDENCVPNIPSEKLERYEWITELIRKAIDHKKLEAPIKPKDFVKWAGKYNIKLPEELINQIELIHGSDTLASRERSSYLNIIGSLLKLMQSKTPPPFGNQSAIISKILEDHPKKDGLSKRNLEKRFSEANRNLEASE